MGARTPVSPFGTLDLTGDYDTTNRLFCQPFQIGAGFGMSAGRADSRKDGTCRDTQVVKGATC